ncbi:MAG: hypothetical protein GXO65_07080 [Euryarchaeota archaeon]|nr:hypothetical protein [Euryarchaeota archaeon]
MAGTGTYIGTAVVIVGLLALVSSGYYFFKLQDLEEELQVKASQLEEAQGRIESLESSLNLPVTREEALEKAAGSFAYLNFSRQHFKDPELRVELASLVWDEARGQYVWKVELMERKCGCGGEASLSSIVFFIDPVTGDILATEEHVAESEQEYARKTCEADCHKG